MLKPEKLEEYKKKYGRVYMIESEDGKVAYIADPYRSLTIAAALMEAIEESTYAYIQVILSDCWIDGDEELRTQEEYGNDLAEQIDEITEIPEYEVKPYKGNFIIKSHGQEIAVRPATRQDIINARKRNRRNKAMLTQKNLLRALAMDGNRVDELLNLEYARPAIGILLGINEVKAKKHTTVKKL